MVHPVYQNRIEKDIRNLISTSDEIENIKHRGLKGAYRESTLGKVIKNYLPFGWDLGSGEIIDSFGETSNEADLLIYNKSIIPPVLFTENEGSYPIESCFYVFEVKTVSTATEIQTTLEKFKNLRKLKSTSARRPVTVYFAYSTDLTKESEFERYRKYDNNFGDDPLIDVLCVIGKGYWFHNKNYKNNKLSSITWYFFEHQDNNFEIGVFLSGIINTINPQYPLGFYIIDETNYKKLIYHKDFTKDFTVSVEKSAAFDSGFKKHNDKIYQEAIRLFSVAIEDNRKLSLFLFDLAIENYHKNNYQASIEYLNQAIVLEGTLKYNYRFFQTRGLAYFNINNFEEAINDFETAIIINPGNTDLYHSLAYTKFCISNLNSQVLSSALMDLNQAIILNNYDEKLFILRGMIHNCLNMLIEARTDFTRAIGLNPKNEETLKQLMIVEHNLSLNGYNNSIIQYQELCNWMKGNYEM